MRLPLPSSPPSPTLLNQFRASLPTRHHIAPATPQFFTATSAAHPPAHLAAELAVTAALSPPPTPARSVFLLLSPYLYARASTPGRCHTTSAVWRSTPTTPRRSGACRHAVAMPRRAWTAPQPTRRPSSVRVYWHACMHMITQMIHTLYHVRACMHECIQTCIHPHTQTPCSPVSGPAQVAVWASHLP